MDDELVQREYVTQRSRLGATFKHDGGLTLRVQVQDVRIWGEEANTLDFSAGGLDLHEAFGDLPLYDGARLRVGRQEIVLDDARLFGNVGWTQRARSFDGARGMWRGEKLDLDLFFLVDGESDADPDGAQGRGQIWVGGLHGTYKTEAVNASLGLYTRKDHPKDELRHTVGLFASGKSEGFIYEAQFWYQLGDLAGESIAAFLTAARAGYALSGPAAPTLTLFGEYLSGDGKPEHAFDTLYATNHKFYGEMDFFLNIPAQTAGLGLLDAGGRLEAKPAEAWATAIDAHLLRTAEPDPNDNSDLGLEIDASASLKKSDKLSFRLLYGIFLPGKAMAGVKGLPEDADLATEHMVFFETDARW
ncbi:MAG: alginate export family protein [bacterium]